MSQKIVINTMHGGFALSQAGVLKYCELAGIPAPKTWSPLWQCYIDFQDCDIPRDSPHLVQVVEALGAEANGDIAALKVVEIPAGVRWRICDYDGKEWVAEQHKTWS